ncbi:MAG: hypothetical protein DRJ49_07170 [Thermoprotei archaeon]|nr:MAG: hypothetical protein DRN53_08175 [Thermoprotei archaeon]RLE86897.1 MAG: hypothetical protein DRJ49_07170 [Thermoprotei archaeon]
MIPTKTTMEIRRNGGIMVTFRGNRVLFDPTSKPTIKPDIIAISHAHRDHYSISVLRYLKGTPVLISRPTLELIFPRGIPKWLNYVEVYPGAEVEIGSLRIKAEEAGHIVGSLQFIIEDDPRVVFTGDFNPESRIILAPARVVKSDILIIESTYGALPYLFPDRSRLYRRLLEIVKRLLESEGSVIIGARSPGTAQEIVALLSSSRLGATIYADERIYEHSIIHAKYDRIGLLIRRFELDKPHDIVVTRLGYSTRLSGRYSVVTCTGWMAQSSDEKALPLSSHADLRGLMQYVKLSNPSEVITVYGFAREFARILRDLGFNARSL